MKRGEFHAKVGCIFMKVGQVNTNSFTLKPSEVNGKGALQIGDSERYLVKLDQENHEWSLVDKVDKDISFDDIKESYGAWQDREIRKGFFKKIIRPRDGKIQSDEIREFQKEYPETKNVFDKSKDPPNFGDKINLMPPHYYYTIKPDAHIEVSQTPQGTVAVLEEKWECTYEGYKAI
jgi:hypothetical protein